MGHWIDGWSDSDNRWQKKELEWKGSSSKTALKDQLALLARATPQRAGCAANPGMARADQTCWLKFIPGTDSLDSL